MFLTKPSRRPEQFTLDADHPLSHGLVFAGLGGHVGGTLYHDASANKVDGALVNFTDAGNKPSDSWAIDGLLNRRILTSVSGKNNSVNLNNPQILTPTGDFSAAIWYYLTANLTGYPMAKGGASGSRVWGLACSSGSGPNYFLTGNQSGAWDVVLTAGTTTAATWTHLAGTVRGTTATIYINGVERGTATRSGTSYVSTGNFTILNTSDVANPFIGSIADPLVYSRCLSPPEIAALADPSNVDLRVGNVPLILPIRRYWPVVGSTGSGPTNYTSSLSGSITSAATLARRGGKPFAAAATPAGSVAKQTAKPRTGAIATAGSITKRAGKALSGSIAAEALKAAKQIAKAITGGVTLTGGTVDKIRAAVRSFAASIAPAGSIAKQAAKSLAGTATTAGAVVKRAAKSIAGSLAPSGGTVSKIKAALRSLSGSIAPSGSITKRAAKGLSGSAAPSGSIAKRLARALSATVTLTGGTVSKIKAALLSLSGSISPAGSLSRLPGKLLSGSIAPAGSLAKRLARALSATLSAAGSFSSVLGGSFSSAAVYFRNFVLSRRG
jgi:hypothetical protein